MVVYTAHAPTGTRPRSLRDGDAVVFVKDGFSLAAMLVPLFWLLAHRCWWHSLAVLAGAVALGLLVRFHPQYDGAATIVGLLASLLVGLEANGWRRWSLSQRGHDMLQARELVAGQAALMAKIEKPAAIADLEAIIANSDGIMVARGDLGVEMPVEKVPGLQKEITRRSRAAGKPVVIATQMLESMITAPVPTRAEVSDVATAVFDGADAIMLSAESAVGKHPLEAVGTMDRIAIEVENDAGYSVLVHATQIPRQATGADAIAAAAHTIADTLKLSAIICYTATGSTALRVARERPGLPVLALTPVVATSRRLALVWGLHGVLTKDPENLADMVRLRGRIRQDPRRCRGHGRRAARLSRRNEHGAHCRARRGRLPAGGGTLEPAHRREPQRTARRSRAQIASAAGRAPSRHGTGRQVRAIRRPSSSGRACRARACRSPGWPLPRRDPSCSSCAAG